MGCCVVLFCFGPFVLFGFVLLEAYFCFSNVNACEPAPCLHLVWAHSCHRDVWLDMRSWQFQLCNAVTIWLVDRLQFRYLGLTEWASSSTVTCIMTVSNTVSELLPVQTTMRGFPIRMVYLYYISCLRYTILVGNPPTHIHLMTEIGLALNKGAAELSYDLKNKERKSYMINKWVAELA